MGLLNIGQFISLLRFRNGSVSEPAVASLARGLVNERGEVIFSGLGEDGRQDASIPNKVNVMGYANHGSNVDYPRPAGYACVEWVGTVTPDNALNGDLVNIIS